MCIVLNYFMSNAGRCPGLWWGLVLLELSWIFLPFGSQAAERPSSLERGFVQPPASARPWILWFWLNGNMSSNGITADLEAMKQAGLGGVVIMDVDQGTPKGPVTFGSTRWFELFRHVCGEAHRLGLQVNMNND